MNSLDALKARIASIKRDDPKPSASTATQVSNSSGLKLSDVLAKAKSLATDAKQATEWRKPKEETFNLKLPSYLDVPQFILQVRRDFPRINIHLTKSHILQVEGLAEYRWLASRI